MKRVVGVALGVLLAGADARAQLSPAPTPSAPSVTDQRHDHRTDQRTPDQLRKEVLDRMRALRAWKIVEALKLDEATSARLFPILSRYGDREMALAGDRHALMHELREETQAPHPEDARLTATLDKLGANRAKLRQLHSERIKEIRKVLTPLQQAKLVLLLPRLERNFAGWIHEASGRGGSPGPGDQP